MASYRPVYRERRDPPIGIARVVIVVYGELIAAAWDDYKIVDGPSCQAASPFTCLRIPSIVSVFPFVIIKICIIPLMTSNRVQQRVRSWTPRFVPRFVQRVHKFHVKRLYTSQPLSRILIQVKPLPRLDSAD